MNTARRHLLILLAAFVLPASTWGSIFTIPEANVGQYSSVAINPATGFPLISYYDIANNRLRFLHCNSATCGSGSLSIVATGGGRWTSFQLNSAGNPVIAYAIANSVRVAVCDDVGCVSVSSDEAVATGLTDPAYVRLRLSSTDNPIVSYHNQGAGGFLGLALCSNASCSTQIAGSPFTVAGPGVGDGRNAALALTSDDRPVISYAEQTDDGPPAEIDLRVLSCNDATCSATTTNTVDPGALGNPSDYTSIEMSAGDIPVISYYDPSPTPASLKLARCVDTACSSATINTVDRGTGATGSWSSLGFGPDGFPVISYYRGDNTLSVARCADAECSDSAISNLDNTIADSNVTTTSLATDGENLYVSYFRADAGPKLGSNQLRVYFNQGYIVDLGRPSASESSGSISFTPTLNTPAPAAGLTVNWSTLVRHDDTADAADFTSSSGTTSFAAGATVADAPITIPLTADALVEMDETFSVIVAPTTEPLGGMDDIAAYGINGRWTVEDAVDADLSISKTNGVATSIPGSDTVYTITASNAGPASAVGATVTDTFPAVCTSVNWTCVGAGGGTCAAAGASNINDSVDLPSGASVTYTATCAINPAATGNLVNTATVTEPADVIDPDQANNEATDSDTLTASADISIEKTAVGVPDPLLIDSPFNYALTAANAGPSSAAGVVVTDTLPTALTYESNDCGATFAEPTLTWNIGELAPGAAPVCNFSVTVAELGEIVNTASISSTTADPNPANDSSTHTLVGAQPADLSIALTSSAGGHDLMIGDNYTYTVTGTNIGPGMAVGLDFSLELASNISFVSSSCSATLSGDTLDWTVAMLANGDSTACVITVEVSAYGEIEALATVATLSADPVLDNNSATLAIGTVAIAVPTLGHWGGLLLLISALGLGALWRRGQLERTQSKPI